MKRAFSAALLAAALLAPAAVSVADTGLSASAIQSEKLQTCEGLTLDSATQHATAQERRHIYHLSGECATRQWAKDCQGGQGQCLYWGTSPHTWKISAQYDAQTGRAFEKIESAASVDAHPWGTMEVTYQCSEDPWRSSDVECRLVETQPLLASERLWFGDTAEPARVGQSSSRWFPYSRSVRPQVLAYQKQQIEAGMTPEIAYPDSGESVDWQQQFAFRACARPLEGWFADLSSPIAGGRGEFTLQRWLPDEGWVTTMQAEPFQGIDDCRPHAVANDPLAEGKWRVAVRHAEEGWPWSDFVEFWVGDPVREDATPPVVQRPKHGEVLASAPVSALAKKSVFKRDFEVEWQPWNDGLGTWEPSEPVRITTQPNQPFDLPDGGQDKARWRVRVASPSDPQYPWSAWQTYYVGHDGRALKERDQKKIYTTKIGGTTLGDRASQGGGLAEGAQKVAMPEARGSGLATVGAASAPRIASPSPGKPIAGDLQLRFSGPDQAVVVEAEQQRVGSTWEAVQSAQLGTPRRSSQGVLIPRSALSEARRVRVHVRRENEASFGAWQVFEVVSAETRDAFTQQGKIPVPAPQGAKSLPSQVPGQEQKPSDALRKKAPSSMPGPER